MIAKCIYIVCIEIVTQIDTQTGLGLRLPHAPPHRDSKLVRRFFLLVQTRSHFFQVALYIRALPSAFVVHKHKKYIYDAKYIYIHIYSATCIRTYAIIFAPLSRWFSFFSFYPTIYSSFHPTNDKWSATSFVFHTENKPHKASTACFYIFRLRFIYTLSQFSSSTPSSTTHLQLHPLRAYYRNIYRETKWYIYIFSPATMLSSSRELFCTSFVRTR